MYRVWENSKLLERERERERPLARRRPPPRCGREGHRPCQQKGLPDSVVFPAVPGRRRREGLPWKNFTTTPWSRQPATASGEPSGGIHSMGITKWQNPTDFYRKFNTVNYYAVLRCSIKWSLWYSSKDSFLLYISEEVNNNYCLIQNLRTWRLNVLL